MEQPSFVSSVALANSF